MTEREFAIDVVRKLQGAGHRALWAGGCVRDELLGLIPKDYDVATDARPGQVCALFPRTIQVGAAFGVVEVIGPRVGGQHLTVEVATFRSDGAYCDGRRPESVTFSSPLEDALRRDFTVNGMFFDPATEELLDYVGGRADLEEGILRAIGDPEKRFEEDKLRMLRAVRIATRFGLTIEPATARAVKRMAAQVTVVSAERVAEEVRKFLTEPQRVRGVELMASLGLVAPVLPELLPLRGLRHPEAGGEDLWGHTLAVLGNLPSDAAFPLAFAALLHEAGRGLRDTLLSAEAAGAHVTGEVAARLRLSNAEKDRAVWLVENHKVFRAARSMRLCRLKRVLTHGGVPELIALHRADMEALGLNTEDLDYVTHCHRAWPRDVIDPPPLVTGQDLIGMGLKPGPKFREILEAVRDAQLDGTVTTREGALGLARKLAG